MKEITKNLSLILVSVGCATGWGKAYREINSCRAALIDNSIPKQKLDEISHQRKLEQAAKLKCTVEPWTQSLIDQKFKEGCGTVFGDYKVDGFLVTRSMSKLP